MEMQFKPLVGQERLYAEKQSAQISGQTGYVGFLTVTLNQKAPRGMLSSTAKSLNATKGMLNSTEKTHYKSFRYENKQKKRGLSEP